MVDQHGDFVWRSLRRLGVPQSDVDDATQQVYIVAAGKLASIEPGRERAFLFATALRVASHARRGLGRRREVPSEAVAEQRDETPGPDELTDRRRGRALLDEALAEMPLDLRAVLVLFELEEMSLTEIASALDLPRGTVASRLRRARGDFTTRANQILGRRAADEEARR